jgi:hypothetical protein
MQQLCETCKNLDLDHLFNGYGQLRGVGRTTSEVEASLGPIINILERKFRCKFCAIVAEKLQDDIDQGNLNINAANGTIEFQDYGKKSTADVQAAVCALRFDHRWWSFMNRAGYFSDYAENWQDGGVPNNTQFPGRNTRECDVVLRVSQEGGKVPFQKTLVSFNQVYDAARSSGEQRLFERRIDPNGPDIPLLRAWISSCLSQHGELCNNPPNLMPLYPEHLRVIDVRKRCVILAPESCSYAALSYVWGGPQFIATEKDLQNLPFVLPAPLTISQSVADAIELCLELGIEFLWVDALCIAQDPYHNPDKAHQVQQMDRIYRSALVTICAVSSTSAKGGIPGLKQRISRQNIFEFKNKRLPRIADVVDYELWNWRAWTYQERMLSRRKIIVSEQQVFWQCQCDAWMESTVAEPTNSDAVGLLHVPKTSTFDLPEWEWGLRYTRAMPGVLTYGTGDSLIQTYELVVSQYTARKIGDPRDGLNGINGILNVLSEGSDRGSLTFFWGLPSTWFDFALLWRPRSGAGRSEVVEKERSIPSWSWAAWFGGKSLGVEWDLSDSGFTDPINKPAIKWFLVQGDGTSKELLVDDATNQSKQMAVCGVMPHAPKNGPPLLPPNVVDKSNFYLHFETTLARFKIGEKLTWRAGTRDLMEWVPEHGRRFVEDFVPDDPYEIIDSKGVCRGHVVLTHDQKESYEGAEANLAFLSYAREFDYSILDSERLKATKAETSKAGDWSIVNCMLMLQRDGYLFYERLSLGKVSQAAWLAAEPETQWIILG